MRTYRTLGTLVLGVAALVADASSAAAADAARLTAYRKDGQTSYALSLKGDLPSQEVAAVDVVVLFDTSASQQGAYREAALAALQSFVAGLRPEDRVQLLAVDLGARALTEKFVAPNDAAASKAVADLGQQAPLGSTDMQAAFAAAVDRFDEAGSKNRAIVYIGDGVSMANMLDAPTLRPIVDSLHAAHVPVSSYAIGPQVDGQLLAVLANQTGGNLYIAEPMTWQNDQAGVSDARAREENARRAQGAGKLLAAWSRSTVLWPAKAQMPDVLGQTYPASFPPLRADRDTVLVGRTAAELTQPVEVQVTAAGGDGQPHQLAWNIQPEPPRDDYAFLAPMVEAASHDGGLTLPTVGMAGLAEAARLQGAQSDQLTMLAERAVASGDRAGALKLVQTVLQTDPGNIQARTVQSALEGAAPDLPAAAAAPGVPSPAAPVAPPAADGSIRLTAPAAPAPIPPAEPGLLESRGPAGSFLDEVEQERRVFGEMLSTEVNNTVIEARERMKADPQTAIQELKLALENVRRAPDLDAAKRAALEDKLQIALREATRKAAMKDETDRLREEELAAARETKYLNDQLTRRIERESQLMSRFNALMDERRYVEAEEVATIVEEIDPNGVTPRAAALWARHKRHDYLMQVARSARHNASWDTMYQVELSHIPFPDNPPIVYPDAPIWEELTKRREGRYSVDLKSEGDAERRIYSALRQPLKTPIEAIAQPLNQITQMIVEDYEIPIQFDSPALDAVAASPEVEVTINVRNVSLRSALELILKNAGTESLTYIVDNEVLLITTQEEAEKRLQTRVYPVADLVLPIESMSMMGGGMMGGGMMGGGGMGGGGMGGGGMGGMGGGGMGGGFGGGGGGMGGGGGGGFFAVPDNVETPPQQPASEADAATPEAKPAEPTPVADAKTDDAATSAAPAASAAAPRVPGIEIDASLSPAEFWSKHFAAKQEDPAVVRRAVKTLIKQKQYDHAISLIQAALAAGQPQPWMYESLGIAMELAGRPKSEIERAIMSACDFSTDPEELMLIARYLSHVDLDRRAVDVYRQVVKAAPLYQEAYALGLRAAQRINDVDGIRWATVGILKQAWPSDQQAIRNAAVRIAQATLEELRAGGKTADAEQFQRDLDEALVRDCVVKVSWSGDADVDLIVEEPGGTSCSLREPRSPGGGVVLGDSYANFEEEAAAEGFSETYVCPQGFAGEYRVRVRKVWGELVADRVTVDVYKNYRAENQQHQRQFVPVGEDDAMIVFNLDQGRRTDPIEGQQLLASVGRQQAISQAVMAQQLGSLSDPSIVPGRGNLSPLDLRRQLALARGGAVGFMPIIITLPEGTQLFATAVVSADRRYVRISASPSFTGIGNVTTFTFAGAGQQVNQTNNGANNNGANNNGANNNGANNNGANNNGANNNGGFNNAGNNNAGNNNGF